MKHFAVILLTAAIAAGCDSGTPPVSGTGGPPTVGPATVNDAKTTPPANAGPAGPTAGSSPAEAATLRGRVVFEGTPPKRRSIDMSAEPHCAQMREGFLAETVVVGENGGLQNAIVYVSKGTAGMRFEPKAGEVLIAMEPNAGTVLIDQVGCTYRPHVIAVMVGEMFRFRNSDPVTHNVHSLAAMNDQFNLSQSTQGQVNAFSFNSPELAARIKCDTHPWMGCWIAVFDHPFFAVTYEDGTFSIGGLPPGEYEISAWQEKLECGPQTVKLAAKETKELTFTFKE